MIKYMKSNLVSCLYFFFIFLILSSIITRGWIHTWGTLNVPALLPPHFDLRFYQYPALQIERGANPLFGVHELWSSNFKGWSDYYLYEFKLAHFLNLHKESYFIGFALFVLINYIFCVYKILNIRKNSFWILILFFSSGSLLGIERTNNDLIIFCLLYWVAMHPNILGVFLYLIAVKIEIWPAIAGIAFIKKKIKIFALILVTFFFIYNFKAIFYENVEGINDWLSFGSKSTSVSIYRFFSVNINYLTITIVLLFFTLFSLIPWLKIFKFEFKKEPTPFVERLFLIGSSIYTGLFIAASNFDYKLIFLIFCVPYVSMLRNKIDKYFILILMVIASNYTWMYNNNLTSVGVFINTIAKCFLFVSLLNLLIKYIYNLFKKYGIKKIFL